MAGQLVGILPNYFAPTMTNTEVKDMPLKDMDFPLDLKICFRPFELNTTALRHFGYINSNSYVLGIPGRNQFNGSFVCDKIAVFNCMPTMLRIIMSESFQRL